MEKRAVVLVFPRCEPDWPDPGKRLGFPLAILTLARSLVAAGFAVRLIDENVIARFDREYALHERPLFVGISCLGGGQIEAALGVARAVRQRHGDVPIVWGGWNPTLLPALYEDVALRGLVDVVVRGRAEARAAELARRFADGRELSGIPGISYWQQDASGGVGTLVREPDGPLEETPTVGALPWRLVEHRDRYLWRNGVANYVSTYGCPHRCTFCGIPVGTPTFRATANEHVVEHMIELRDLGARTIVFYDDNFFTSKPRVLDLAKRLVAADVGVRWYSNGRVDQISRFRGDELEVLASSGCAGFNVGYETGEQSVADRARKDLDVASMPELASRLHQAGIHLSINFMVGLPGETPESLARSLETLFDLHARHPSIEVCWYMFMPSPGTEAWRELVIDGKLTEPRSLAEHARLQYLYLEHPWFYVSPPDDVFREWRAKHKAVAFWFHCGWASAPPRTLLGRTMRRLARWRFTKRRFAWPIDWWCAFAWNRVRTSLRIAAARRRWARNELPRDFDVPPPQDTHPSVSSTEGERGALPWARGAM